MNTYFTLADGRSSIVYSRLFGHVWLRRWVVDTLSHCTQYGRHGQ